MYFPILRGRQFELLALRECVKEGILSNEIIPIIEPVKVSSTYTKTIDAFIKQDKKIAIIRNPQVGVWAKDLLKESNNIIKEEIVKQFENENIISSFYVIPSLKNDLAISKTNSEVGINSMIFLLKNPDYLDIYYDVVGSDNPLYNLIPDRGDFRRRILQNRIICEDHFPKQTRNIDYINKNDEFFSADHLYYNSDGYNGFSDYSVIGEEYNETGFAPYAVAIHIVYFDNNKNLRIAHFVSDSNDDISDPARKFSEAAAKLVEWNKTKQLKTKGIQALEETYENSTYPGLGVIKKYSIMHHLELMSLYLDSN